MAFSESSDRGRGVPRARLSRAARPDRDTIGRRNQGPCQRHPGLQQNAGARGHVGLRGVPEREPGSSWRASVLANLGSAYRRTGYFTKSLAAALEAWSLAKDIADPHAEAVAGIALGELAELHARLGHRHELADLIAEADKRVLAGPVAAKVAGARQGLAMMVQMPEYSYRCGPLAVGRVLAAVSSVDEKKVSAINGPSSTDRGTNLAQLRRLAQSVGLKGRPAFRESSSTLPIVPAVIHWKAGHFAAVVREIDGRYRSPILRLGKTPGSAAEP